MKRLLIGMASGVAVVLLIAASVGSPTLYGTFKGVFVGNGGGATNLNGGSITGLVSAVFSGSGNGGALTNLNSGSLTGSVAVARLPAGLNASNYVGVFIGDGAAITNITVDSTNAVTAQYVTESPVTNQIGAQAYLTVNSANAAGIPVAIRGHASQSADLFQAQTSGADSVFAVSIGGDAICKGYVVATNAIMLPSHTMTVNWLDAPTNGAAGASPVLWLVVTNKGVGYGIPLHALTP